VKPHKSTVLVETIPEDINMRGLIGPPRIEIEVEYLGQVLKLRLSHEQASKLAGDILHWQANL
jgi:hypothetical protein